MIVPYTRFLSFLINGLDKSYRNNLYRIKDDLEFTFNEYVLSQMHLAIVCHLLKRDLYVIHRVYRYIAEGREVDKADVIAVLQWYYRDMAGFFRTIAGSGLLKGISLKVEAPGAMFASLGIEAEEISFTAEKQEVVRALELGEGKYESYVKLDYRDLKNSPDSKSIFETEEQRDRYVTSVILLYSSKQDKIIRWCKDDCSTDSTS